MRARRFLPLLLLLFIASGCAALIYEIVWFELLQLVIGSSAISLSILLGTFMGGMCVGSLALSRVIGARHHPLRVYAALEIGVGAIGLAVPVCVPIVGGYYASWAGSGIAGILLRGIAAGVCLLPPTLLMGATLPAISRWVDTDSQGISWLGLFYGGNIAGAVAGSLIAGFYLLRVYDVATATYVAVALNVAVSLLALILAGITPAIAAREPAGSTRRAPDAWSIYLAVALSGMTALAAEVVWTRLLSLLFGATVYTFSLILAVFLIGLGIGSSVGSAAARSLAWPRVVFGACQILLCGAIAWTAYMLTDSLPYWPVNPSISTDPWFTFQLDFVRCLWAVLPGAVLWGASFPLALASVALPGQDPARLVGGIYAANTLGAIAGAVGAPFLVLWRGSQYTQQALIVICAISALLALEPASAGGDRVRSRLQFAVLLVAVGGAALLARAVHQVPPVLVGYGRYAATRVGQADFVYVGEGLNASVAVSRLSNGVLNYHNAGKVQASSEPQDMRLQRMLGHLTTLIPEHPRSVLVIGCGAGVTAGAVSIDPKVEHETIAEIEPLVPLVVSTYFSEHNFDVVRNPKVTVENDDARHYLLTSSLKFDGITSDPLDPWVKGAAMLYTGEFFEMVKEHLNPGGVVTLFVQLYESNEAAVKSEMATFFEAFPNGIIWGNTNNGAGYDLVLLGQVEPTRIDVDRIQTRLNRSEYRPVARSLQEIGFASAIDLFATYAGRGPDLTGWLKDAAINRDRNLRLQYLAGLGLNLYQSGTIYSEMLAYSRFPEQLFVGSEALKRALREAIEHAQGR
jgi:spermidine synthase